MKTTTFRRLLTFRVPLWALVVALPVVPLARTFWYMQGEDGGRHLDYFFFVLPESLPFVLAYIFLVVALSFLASNSLEEDNSDILHP
jgi:hypothetical protein